MIPPTGASDSRRTTDIFFSISTKGDRGDGRGGGGVLKIIIIARKFFSGSEPSMITGSPARKDEALNSPTHRGQVLKIDDRSHCFVVLHKATAKGEGEGVCSRLLARRKHSQRGRANGHESPSQEGQELLITVGPCIATLLFFSTKTKKRRERRRGKAIATFVPSKHEVEEKEEDRGRGGGR